MSLDQLLLHTCTIENPRITDGKTLNVYNNEKLAYGEPLEGVRCRLVESRVKVWVDERQESVIQSVYKLIVPTGTLLDKRARITKITMEDGSVVRENYAVNEIYNRRSNRAHHVTAILERIS